MTVLSTEIENMKAGMGIDAYALNNAERRTALTEALKALSTTALTAIRTALREEEYICTGRWTATGGEEVHSGCLFTAAYMRTDEFHSLLDPEAGCSISEALRGVAGSIEMDDALFVANALETSHRSMNDVITLFDAWGENDSDLIRLEYKNEKGLPDFLELPAISKEQRTSLKRTVSNILANRRQA